ncbi:ABC transporter permease [Prevotella sp. A2931]|uniref:ABC transporter permease n=1 Tax=Prevotella illustrans TaxID=2800387 RepID=A0ABS3M5X6_9BACT|nr:MULTISPECIES: ABC transporter permease [Prevotella]MBO1363539.1 ABC transporter permease [Prevotella illustrans]PTL27061.1 ABC transporter permease [Prevotella sp. oral taxon 820]
MRDVIAEIWSTAKRNKLRTALTGFAVAWGIFMLIFLLGAGNGLINATMQNSDRFMANSMSVYGGRTSKAFEGLKEGRWITLNDKDFETTTARFASNVDEMGASISQNSVTISYRGNYTSTSLNGVYPNEADIYKLEMCHGRFINRIDNEQSRKVLVINEDQAKELTTGDIAGLVGQYVDVGAFGFRIVGIYKSDRSGGNSAAYTAFNTVRGIYGRGDKADELHFSFHGLNTEEDNKAFEKRYRAGLNRNHRAAPDDEGAIWLHNRFTDVLQMNTGIAIIRTALWIIGLFTLLSGIVGVSNIMLITVKERTREFGIRKAIGAKPWSILKLIIVESVIITTFFGYIGMLMGIAANEYMDATIGHMQIDSGMFTATMFVNPRVGIDVCIEATLVMVLAGTLAGLIPARKAAKIRPIEALRAE